MAAPTLFPDGLCASPCHGRLRKCSVSGVASLVCEQCGEATPEFETETVFGDESYTTRYEPPQAVPFYGTPEARKRDAFAAARYRDRAEYDPFDDKSDINPHTRTTKY